jgi:hypothetical protein
MSYVSRFNDKLCGCCRRYSVGVAYSPAPRKPLLWLCADPECINLAMRSYNVRQDEFTRMESRAAIEGGKEAGAFLEQIGKAEGLGALEPEEWFEFCRRLVAGYRKALVGELNNEAPF